MVQVLLVGVGAWSRGTPRGVGPVDVAGDARPSRMVIQTSRSTRPCTAAC